MRVLRVRSLLELMERADPGDSPIWHEIMTGQVPIVVWMLSEQWDGPPVELRPGGQVPVALVQRLKKIKVVDAIQKDDQSGALAYTPPHRLFAEPWIVERMWINTSPENRCADCWYPHARAYRPHHATRIHVGRFTVTLERDDGPMFVCSPRAATIDCLSSVEVPEPSNPGHWFD